MKKYILRSILKTIVVAIIVLFVFYVIYSLYNTPNIEKDQYWIKEYVEKNPYSKVYYDTIEVIDVANNFALVKYNGDTIVMETDIVKYNRKKIDKK